MTISDPLRETEQFTAMRDALRRAVTTQTPAEATRRARRRHGRGLLRRHSRF
jgi:hypothetical protein